MRHSNLKNHLLLILWILAFPSQSFAEKAQEHIANFVNAEEIRVTFGVDSSGVVWEAKVNGIEIPTGGNFEHRSKGVQLYHKNHPIKARIHPDYKGLLCLNEGRNKIHISFRIDDIDDFKKDNSVIVYINALPYDKKILEYRTAELNFGEIEAEFFVFKKMPEGYKTKIIE